MAHECLVMSNRPGPDYWTSNTANIPAVWPDWVVRLPAGSIYVGLSIRFRASGVMTATLTGGSIRPYPVFAATAATQPAVAMTALMGNPVVSTRPVLCGWTLDYTMTCRTVPVAGATFFPGAFFASSGVVGSITNQNDGVVPSIVSPPVVSTGALVPTTDVWLSLGFAVGAGNSLAFRVENYRVDKIA